jgi:hypothetical protein
MYGYGSHGKWCNAKTYPTKCKYCGKQIFYFTCDCGSKVFFDSLGGCWPIHTCYCDEEDDPYIIDPPKINRNWTLVDEEDEENVTFTHESDITKNNKKGYEIPIIKIESKLNDKIEIHGEIIEVTDIDIYKKFEMKETSIGAIMLKNQFPENNYIQLTIHSPIFEKNNKNSYNVLISKCEYNKLGLKKGFTIISVREGNKFKDIKYWNYKTIKKVDK